MDREIVKEESMYDFYREQTLLLADENKELKNKYNITRDNFYALAKRINKAIEYIEHRQEDINNGGNEHEYKSNEFIMNILKGEDKK